MDKMKMKKKLKKKSLHTQIAESKIRKPHNLEYEPIELYIIRKLGHTINRTLEEKSQARGHTYTYTGSKREKEREKEQ